MNIPIVEWTPMPDRVIRWVGCEKPAPSWYKMGLLNALIHFRPKECLEIGTNTGGTVRVFEHYFSNYMPDGHLVTVDIVKHGHFESKWTNPLLVYPYSADEVAISSNAARKPALADWPGHVASAYDENKAAIEKAHPDKFDFAYIDGDHSLLGVSNDWRMVKKMAIPVAVFDDIHYAPVAVPEFYLDVVCKETREHYEFEDWPVRTGIGVVTL